MGLFLDFFGDINVKKLSLCLAGLLALTSAATMASDARIGVVDLQKIMQTSAQMKSIQEILEKEFQPRRDNLIAMEEKLKKDTA